MCTTCVTIDISTATFASAVNKWHQQQGGKLLERGWWGEGGWIIRWPPALLVTTNISAMNLVLWLQDHITVQSIYWSQSPSLISPQLLIGGHETPIPSCQYQYPDIRWGPVRTYRTSPLSLWFYHQQLHHQVSAHDKLEVDAFVGSEEEEENYEDTGGWQRRWLTRKRVVVLPLLLLNRRINTVTMTTVNTTVINIIMVSGGAGFKRTVTMVVWLYDPDAQERRRVGGGGGGGGMRKIKIRRRRRGV